jgi:hypothetical protein
MSSVGDNDAYGSLDPGTWAILAATSGPRSYLVRGVADKYSVGLEAVLSVVESRQVLASRVEHYLLREAVRTFYITPDGEWMMHLLEQMRLMRLLLGLLILQRNPVLQERVEHALDLLDPLI